jgi:hypothetical protein
MTKSHHDRGGRCGGNYITNLALSVKIRIKFLIK